MTVRISVCMCTGVQVSVEARKSWLVHVARINYRQVVSSYWWVLGSELWTSARAANCLINESLNPGFDLKTAVPASVGYLLWLGEVCAFSLFSHCSCIFSPKNSSSLGPASFGSNPAQLLVHPASCTDVCKAFACLPAVCTNGLYQFTFHFQRLREALGRCSKSEVFRVPINHWLREAGLCWSRDRDLRKVNTHFL